MLVCLSHLGALRLILADLHAQPPHNQQERCSPEGNGRGRDQAGLSASRNSEPPSRRTIGD
eukprot:m.294011 g.294011  ORF g.294011 m.294011 type:complete len:61 (+) comp36371_c0_seq1:68-250(+)